MRKVTTTELQVGDRVHGAGTVLGIRERVQPGSPGEFGDLTYWVVTFDRRIFINGSGMQNADYVTFSAAEVFDLLV